MNGLPCVVLAGGLGTRLRSAVPDLPKCLAPVAGRPFLELQMQALQAEGVTSFVLSLGYMAEAVRGAVSDFELSVPVSCVVETRALGTGGAVLFAMDSMQLDEAWVVNGDTFIDASLGPMVMPLDRAAGEYARMAVIKVVDRGRYGGVELAGGRVQSFLEKGNQGAGLINAGLYRLNRHVFDGRNVGDVFSMESDVMPALLAAGAVWATTLEGEFIDIGVPDDYYRFCGRYSEQP